MSDGQFELLMLVSFLVGIIITVAAGGEVIDVLFGGMFAVLASLIGYMVVYSVWSKW